MAKVSSCVLITQTDYKDTELRDAIKKIGGTWQKQLKGWVLPEVCRTAAEKLVNGEELTPEDTAEIADPTADPMPTSNAEAEVDVSDYRKKGAEPSSKVRSVIVRGDTKPLKSVLMAMSGSWNRVLEGWIFPVARKEQIIRVLQKDTTNIVSVDSFGKDNEFEDDELEDEEGEDEAVSGDEEEQPPMKKIKKEKNHQ